MNGAANQGGQPSRQLGRVADHGRQKQQVGARRYRQECQQAQHGVDRPTIHARPDANGRLGSPHQVELVEHHQPDVGEELGCEGQEGETPFRGQDGEGGQDAKILDRVGVLNALGRDDGADPFVEVSLDLADEGVGRGQIEHGLAGGDRGGDLQGRQGRFPRAGRGSHDEGPSGREVAGRHRAPVVLPEIGPSGGLGPDPAGPGSGIRAKGRRCRDEQAFAQDVGGAQKQAGQMVRPAEDGCRASSGRRSDISHEGRRQTFGVDGQIADPHKARPGVVQAVFRSLAAQAECGQLDDAGEQFAKQEIDSEAGKIGTAQRFGGRIDFEDVGELAAGEAAHRQNQGASDRIGLAGRDDVAGGFEGVRRAFGDQEQKGSRELGPDRILIEPGRPVISDILAVCSPRQPCRRRYNLARRGRHKGGRAASGGIEAENDAGLIGIGHPSHAQDDAVERGAIFRVGAHGEAGGGDLDIGRGQLLAQIGWLQSFQGRRPGDETAGDLVIHQAMACSLRITAFARAAR